MTDGQLLFLIMALIYFGECLVWLPWGAHACLRSIGSRRRLKTAPSNFSSSTGGWVIANPFPPLGSVFVTRPFPVCANGKRFTVFALESPNPGFRRDSSGNPAYSWEQVERITRDGKKVYVNGELLLKESTPEAAHQLVMFLKEVWKSPEDGRTSRIRRYLRRSFDERQVSRLVRFWEDRTRDLRIWCNLLLVLLFGGIPASLIFFGPSRELLGCGLAALGSMFFIAFRFLALYRRCYPGLHFERWQWFFLILLVPQQSVRAHDLLLKAVTAPFHPLAVADFALASDPGNHRATTGSLFRDLVHPLPWQDRVPEDKREIIDDYYESSLLPAVEAFAARKGQEREQWLSPPQEEGEQAYCPRCFEKFLTLEIRECRDCGGMRTKPFAA